MVPLIVVLELATIDSFRGSSIVKLMLFSGSSGLKDGVGAVETTGLFGAEMVGVGAFDDGGRFGLPDFLRVIKPPVTPNPRIEPRIMAKISSLSMSTLNDTINDASGMIK